MFNPSKNHVKMSIFLVFLVSFPTLCFLLLFISLPASAKTENKIKYTSTAPIASNIKAVAYFSALPVESEKEIKSALEHEGRIVLFKIECVKNTIDYLDGFVFEQDVKIFETSMENTKQIITQGPSKGQIRSHLPYCDDMENMPDYYSTGIGKYNGLLILPEWVNIAKPISVLWGESIVAITIAPDEIESETERVSQILEKREDEKRKKQEMVDNLKDRTEAEKKEALELEVINKEKEKALREYEDTIERKNKAIEKKDQIEKKKVELEIEDKTIEAGTIEKEKAIERQQNEDREQRERIEEHKNILKRYNAIEYLIIRDTLIASPQKYQGQYVYLRFMTAQYISEQEIAITRIYGLDDYILIKGGKDIKKLCQKWFPQVIIAKVLGTDEIIIDGIPTTVLKMKFIDKLSVF